MRSRHDSSRRRLLRASAAVLALQMAGLRPAFVNNVRILIVQQNAELLKRIAAIRAWREEHFPTASTPQSRSAPRKPCEDIYRQLNGGIGESEGGESCEEDTLFTVDD